MGWEMAKSVDSGEKALDLQNLGVLLDLMFQESSLNVYAGERDVRPPSAPTTSGVAASTERLKRLNTHLLPCSIQRRPIDWERTRADRTHGKTSLTTAEREELSSVGLALARMPVYSRTKVPPGARESAPKSQNLIAA